MCDICRNLCMLSYPDWSCSGITKGPLFLPSEHDELPSGVAFMVRAQPEYVCSTMSILIRCIAMQTLTNHTAPITGIDFSEPYGTLVSSSLDETVRIWDLSSGDEVGRLRGHQGAHLVSAFHEPDSSAHLIAHWVYDA